MGILKTVKCMKLSAALFYCSCYCTSVNSQEDAAASDSSLSPFELQPSSTHLPMTTTGVMSNHSPLPLMQWVIVLGACAGFFLLTTILSCTLLLAQCYRMHKLKTASSKPRDKVLEGHSATPLWINAIPDEKVETSVITDAPQWTTFSRGNSPLRSVTEKGNDIAKPNEYIESASPTKCVSSSAKTTPRRVAPSPPKNKDQKKNARPKRDDPTDRVYAEPSNHRKWNVKASKSSKYEEIDVSQRQPPNHYTIPQTT